MRTCKARPAAPSLHDGASSFSLSVPNASEVRMFGSIRTARVIGKGLEAKPLSPMGATILSYKR